MEEILGFAMVVQLVVISVYIERWIRLETDFTGQHVIRMMRIGANLAQSESK